MMGFGFGMGALGLIWMLLFWGGIILLAVWLINLLFPATKESQERSEKFLSAPEILKARYARGEITQEQYQEMLHTIQK